MPSFAHGGGGARAVDGGKRAERVLRVEAGVVDIDARRILHAPGRLATGDADVEQGLAVLVVAMDDLRPLVGDVDLAALLIDGDPGRAGAVAPGDFARARPGGADVPDVTIAERAAACLGRAGRQGETQEDG